MRTTAPQRLRMSFWREQAADQHPRWSGPYDLAPEGAEIGLLRPSGVRNMAAAVRTHAWHAKRAIALVTTAEGIAQSP